MPPKSPEAPVGAFKRHRASETRRKHGGGRSSLKAAGYVRAPDVHSTAGVPRIATEPTSPQL
eukprot:8533171-Pyramimonas_sp.AAC.1